VYTSDGNDLNEGYYDVFVPRRKLKTTIKVFQGVQIRFFVLSKEIK